MRSFLYLIICILTLTACTGNKVQHTSRYTTFPTNQNLYAQVIQLDTALFRYPFRIAVRDSVALVLDLHNPDHYFHAFTYPDWKHLTSFGRRGEAPEEMLSAESFHFLSLDSIWTLDANKTEITRWHLSPSLASAQREESISLDKKLVRTLDFYPMKAGFLVPDYLGAFRFHQINQKGECQSSHRRIPTQVLYKDAAAPALAQAWRSYMAYHSNHNILAMVTQLGEVLDIYNLNDNTHIIKRGPEGEPKFKISQEEAIPNGIMGFSDIQITNTYIYTIFHGRSFKEMADMYMRGEEPEDGGRFIYVFNLEGEPVCKYTLDRAIYGFYVNEEEGIITATDVNHDEPIIQFKI